MLRERGDTLIEVIFATAVLALIIVLAIGIMTSGTAQTERAVEGTFVRQAIDSQTEMLRYERDAFVSGTPNIWEDITGHRVGSVTPFGDLASNPTCTPSGGRGAFYLAHASDAAGGVAVKTDFQSPATYAAPGQGIWIEATPQSNVNYVDFYVYGCWDPPGSGPKSTTGTVVRMYAPVN